MYAIKAQNLTKHYRVYLRPLDRLKEALTRRPCHQLVRALENVSFQIPHGQTLGIIGENGAGKSTLLKILAGTVTPSSGHLKKKGRVAALLELGSGFHPEFSGRGNIHLNAALLGLPESEIREQEGAIIEFAELAEVIDRPVKTYSSGMYMRLAFSIATSVDPDILIIDEALGVGDQKFQQKCVDRMMGFKEAGKTIIVCSHSMFMINTLCAESIWLADGGMRSHGKTSTVISEYLAYLEEGVSKTKEDKAAASGPGAPMPQIMAEELLLLDESENPIDTARQFQTLIFQIKTCCIGPPIKGHLGLIIERPDGQPIFTTTTQSAGFAPLEFAGRQTMRLVVPSIPFFSGNYLAKVVIADEHVVRAIHELKCEPFLVESDHPEFGMLWMAHEWVLDAKSAPAATEPKDCGGRACR